MEIAISQAIMRIAEGVQDIVLVQVLLVLVVVLE
jgi:hypothetical protein